MGAVFTFRDVTERRKAQDQLEFQATTLQNVRDSIIVTDDRGQVIYWNQGAQAIFGYSADEMLGKSLAVLYPGLDAASYRADLEKVTAGTDYVGEWKGNRKDGTLVWVDIKTTLFRNAAGEPIGFIGVASDITERKLAEERLTAQYRVTSVLAESETLDEATPQILRAICEIAGWEVGVLWSLDPEADVLRCLDVWHLPAINIAEFERLTREMLFPREVGLPGRVWASGAPASVQDIAEDSHFPRGKVASKNGLRGAFAFPITSGDRLIGVLEFLSRDARQPDTRLLDMMSSLGSQIGQFIERKRAEEALRLSREQQAIILRGVADGVTAQGPNGELTYANDAAARLIGFASPEELLATPAAEIMSRFEVMDETGQPLPPLQLPGRLATAEKRHVERLMRFRTRPDSEERWSFVRATPVLDEHGNAQFAINIFHDVTDSHRAEQQAREQSELLRVTLASIGDAVISTDTQGKITFMNSVAESLTGWTAQEAIGQPLDPVFRILNEETGAVVESPVSRALRERQVIKLSEGTLLIARDGKRIVIDDSGAPIRDAHGSLVGIVLTFRDITEKQRTERAISQLAAIVQSTDDAILTTTVEGIVQTWNPGAEALYGYSADEIIGRSIMITYPPDHHEEFRDIVERLKRREPAAHFDTARLRKDGRRIDVSITPSAIRDAAGRLVGVSKIARDITESKRAERTQRFLADAGDVLASSFDYETTLKSVAQLAVPQIADWCAVHIQAEDGTIQQLALAHVDPNKLKLAFEFQKQYPPDPDAPTGAVHVIRTGKPQLVQYLTDDQISAAAKNKDHLGMLLELNPRSYMIVPLSARGRTLGAITLLSSESGRRHDHADLALAQELARRAALAVDNARLYREAQALNEELERRVIHRTIELQNANQRLENEIAERQRANEQLRLLSGHLQSAREDERIRIAREIHDEIGQALTAVKMDLSLLEREMAKRGEPLTPDQLHEQLGSTKQLVDQALATMHGIVRELRPEILDHLGLRAAIEWQLQEFQTRTQITCEFDCNHEVDLDQERAIAVFRILQETLTNVARHSGATKVHILLSQQDHHLLLQVQDNGKGIDEQMLQESRTFGIMGMRERAHVFGGDVAINGTPGQGTVVSVQIPL
jgi:PAS domain S-box-containing protein